MNTGENSAGQEKKPLQKISTDKLLKPMAYLGAAIGEWRLLQQLEGHIYPQMISLKVKADFLKSAEVLNEAAAALSMHTSRRVIETGWEDALQRLAPQRPLTAHELQAVTSYADRVVQTFAAEAETLSLMALAPGHVAYAAPEKPLFGDAVENAFPTASPDIADAGRCRAAGLWTASAMHLMRALEPALNALAASLDVTPDQNWNSALNQIETKLREIRKSTDGAEMEQWASEAVLQLRSVKNAWRNHAMHAQVRYGEEDAVRIFDSVKYLMQTLAARLAE